MKIKCTLTFIILFISISISAQLNLTKVGQLPYTQDLSDIWGYADSTGHEYALVGVFDGFSIVDIDTPSNPKEVAFIPGAETIWRDIKVWKDHAFVTNESDSGLLIVDLRFLPDSISHKRINPSGLQTTHNVFIDENGIGYLVGGNVPFSGGALIMDFDTDPWNPTVLGTYDNEYIHDIYVRGDTMWNSEINAGQFAVVDATDKSATSLPANTMALQGTPGVFTHNDWLSDDGDYLFTTDEIPNAYIGSYDVSDLNNISEVDRIQTQPGSNTIVHNTFYNNGYLVTSYYTAGVTIHDANEPSILVEVGSYDTSPNFSGDGFNGCWGVYPYLPSGLILATDIEEGLYILEPEYTRASYVTGLISDSACNISLNNASVEILGTGVTASTDLTGAFKFGIPDTGSFTVRFSAPGYLSKDVVVQLNAGIIANINVKLDPVTTTQLNILVEDVNSNPIPFAHVLLSDVNNNFNFEYAADVNGTISVCGFLSGTYDIYSASWSYLTKESTNVAISGPTSNNTIVLDEGYYDDFLFDLGWTVSGNATAGIWEIDDPIGTTFFGGALINPEDDVNGDFGLKAYITGNGGGQAGSDDVDDGNTVITTPLMDLSSYTDPHISFYWWFVNAGGGGNPDDSLVVRLTDGNTTKTVLKIDANSNAQSQWNREAIRVCEYFDPSAGMQLIVETSDLVNGHLVEAGMDKLFVFDSLVNQAPIFTDVNSTSTNEILETIYSGVTSEICFDFTDANSNDQQTISIINNANNGNVWSNTQKCYFYNPSNNYVGFDSITLEICDNGKPVLCDTLLIVLNVLLPNAINEVENFGSVSISPNPSSTNFVVNYNMKKEGVELVLYNVAGQEIHSTTLNKQGSYLFGTDLLDGVYFLQFKHDSEISESFKLIKTE